MDVLLNNLRTAVVVETTAEYKEKRMLVTDVKGQTFEISEDEKFRISKQADIDNIRSIIEGRFDEEGRDYSQEELNKIAVEIQIEMENSDELSEIWDENFQYYFGELT